MPTIEELTPEVWDRYYGINVRGAIQMTRAVLPSLRKAAWGRIVNNTTSNCCSALSTINHIGPAQHK